MFEARFGNEPLNCQFFFCILQMMRNLFLSEGDLVNIESATLPVATYAKFQPQTVDFLDITDPKAVYLFQMLLFLATSILVSHI